MRMNKQKYTRLNITLPNDLLEEFDKYCQMEGMMLSSRIAVLIKRDLEENVKTVHYRIFFFDDNKRVSEIIRDKQEFIEKTKLSKTRNEEGDVEIYISQVKSIIGIGTTIINRDDTNQEVYYGKISDVKNFLKEELK